MFARNTILRTLKATRTSTQVFYRFNSNREVLKKYHEKLEAKAKQLGYKTVEELNENLKQEIESKKKSLNGIDPLKDLEGFEKEQATKMQQNMESQQIKIRSPVDKDAPITPYKTLHSYLDTTKLEPLNKTEIEYLWRARFAKDARSMVGVLHPVQFSQMYALGFKFRTFVLPLPKENAGYEMHFVQWAFVGPHTTHCMLTTLAEFKLHKEYAKPHTTLMFHQELGESKDIVLMNAHVEEEANLTLDEAQLLVLNIQRFYGAMNTVPKSKLDLLSTFNTGTEFDMEKLIEEATSLE